MISVDNITLQFAGQRIFQNVSLDLGTKDRIGLIGRNGAGKSTLLKLLIQDLMPDEGSIVVPEDISIGYLPQQLSYNDTRNVLDEAMTAFIEINNLETEIKHLNKLIENRTDYDSDSYLELIELVSEKNDRLHIINTGNKEAIAEQTLTGLGFERSDFTRNTREFSGGWRMRIELAKILLKSPDVFLLDEPTNHLDIESIQWLENFLANYHGSVVLISHDREFLNTVTNRTVEISLGKLYDYKASYSKYVELRKDRREKQLAAYNNQQKYIEETKEFIERFRYKATKAVQVQSRIKQLEKLDIIEVDEEDTSSINIKFPPAPRSGSVVFEAKKLTKAYGDNEVLKNIDILIERGEKVAFVGKNGEGKTTLSRIICNEMKADGEYRFGYNVKLGYFAQNQEELLDENKTVFETIDDIAVGDIRTKIRDILGAFLFKGDDIDKKVKVLSGGEKSRLSIIKLLLEPYNLLVLDEPTNHLDMLSKDLLKQALLLYDGTLILVSHDREFLDGLTDKIYEFKNKNIKEHLDNIYQFLEKKNIESLNDLNTDNRIVLKNNNSKYNNPKTQNKLNYEKRKEHDKKVKKNKREIDRIEKEIEDNEKKQAELESQLSNGDTSNPEIFKEYEKIKDKLFQLMIDWEKLNTESEKLSQEKM